MTNRSRSSLTYGLSLSLRFFWGFFQKVTQKYNLQIKRSNSLFNISKLPWGQFRWRLCVWFNLNYRLISSSKAHKSDKNLGFWVYVAQIPRWKCDNEFFFSLIVRLYFRVSQSHLFCPAACKTCTHDAGRRSYSTLEPALKTCLAIAHWCLLKKPSASLKCDKHQIFFEGFTSRWLTDEP